MPEPRTMLYYDRYHPRVYMYEPPMQKEEYESAVDQWLAHRGQVAQPARTGGGTSSSRTTP